MHLVVLPADDDAEATLHGLEDTADHAWEHCSDNGTKPDSPAVVLGGVITPATISATSNPNPNP